MAIEEGPPSFVCRCAPVSGVAVKGVVVVEGGGGGETGGERRLDEELEGTRAHENFI